MANARYRIKRNANQAALNQGVVLRRVHQIHHLGVPVLQVTAAVTQRATAAAIAAAGPSHVATVK